MGNAEGDEAFNASLGASVNSEKVMIVTNGTATNTNTGHDEDVNNFYEDPKAARRLLIKCDLRLIPILGCLYLVSFLDRSNIANARLFGLEKSLDMPSNGFNTCLWIFYLPFVIVEIPSNLFMSLNKIKPNQWLAGAMLILGTRPLLCFSSLDPLLLLLGQFFHLLVLIIQGLWN